MSIFKWLSGGDFESHRQVGEECFAAGNWGEARLSFQRALKKTRDADSDAILKIKGRITECASRLAFQKLDAARDFFSHGDTERAFEALEDALLISDAEDVAASVEACREEFLSLTENEEQEGHSAMSDDELVAVIAGAWGQEMAAEFSKYPELFYKALILAHDGDAEGALELLEEVAKEVDVSSARYYFFELGRLQLLAQRLDDAKVSLNRFVARCSDSVRVEELWVAHEMLSTIHAETGDYSAAEAELMNAFRAAPGNHVPLLHLGIFLRERGEFERSRRTLENAMDTMGAIHPDMRVLRELGHTHLAMGERKDAIRYYKAVLDHCCKTVGHEQYDPEAAIPLARIYEEDGKLQDASDIFRHLAKGHDSMNHFLYHLESARLLRAQNADSRLVGEYLETATELANTDDERQMVGLYAR